MGGKIPSFGAVPSLSGRWPPSGDGVGRGRLCRSACHLCVPRGAFKMTAASQAAAIAEECFFGLSASCPVLAPSSAVAVSVASHIICGPHAGPPTI